MLIAILVLLLVVVSVLIGCFVGVKTVKENTATLFELGGRCVYIAKEARSRHFDACGNVVAGEGDNTIGGCWCILRIIGWVFYLKPLVEAVSYGAHNAADGFGEKNKVYLHDVVLQPLIQKAWTKAPENVPLDVAFIMPARVINPYKWVYDAPFDARAKAVLMMEPFLRSWVRIGDENHVQVGLGNGEEVWNEIMTLGPGNDGQLTVDYLRDVWGLEIIKNKIKVIRITPDLKHQEKLEAARDAKLEADAEVEQTAGRKLRAVAMEAGYNVSDPIELAEFMKKLKDNPALRGIPAAQGGFKEAFENNTDQIKRDRANVTEWRVGAPDGSAMPNLQMVGGGGGGFMMGDRKNKRDKRPDGDVAKLGPEEKAAFMEEFRRKAEAAAATRKK